MRFSRTITTSGSLLFLFFFLYSTYLLAPIGVEGGSARVITVTSGMGVEEIAELLAGGNLIRSKNAFKAYGIVSGSAHTLKPGLYPITTAMSTPKIVKMIAAGPADLVVVVTEGKTLKDIDDQFSELGLIAAGEIAKFPVNAFTEKYPFLAKAKTLEGFLFPDTYRISPDATAGDIVNKMLENFTIKALPLFGRTGDELSPDWYNNLILASLIEREVPFSEDRRIVSGIFQKRLKIGIPLQVDATIVYLACEGRSKGCDPLTKSNFRIQSKVNTYLHRGIPPFPIANPGSDAIIAARNPKTSDFLYYLSAPQTQQTIFSKTLEEHNEHRAQYLHL
ncbi:MAG: endolytic transglycosylase MltG [Patescibacteria group bacterium]